MRKTILLLAAMCCLVINSWSTSYELYVAGIQVTDDNKNAITGTGITGKVSYNSETNTLTLDNAKIEHTCDIITNGGAITTKIALTINCIGENTIECKGEFGNGIANDKDLTLEGTGKLSVKGSCTGIYNLYTNSIITIANCEVTVEGLYGAISHYSGSSYELFVDKGTLLAKGNGTYATIYGCSSLTMIGVDFLTETVYTSSTFYDLSTKEESKADIKIGPKPTSYTITATATNGTVTGGGTYKEGETVTLTATPDEGYEFKEWSDGSTDNPYTFTATEDVTIEAIFVEEQEIKYIDADGKEQTCTSATIVENASTRVYWSAGWYVVNSDVTLSKGAQCMGDVHLILMDGKSLTATGEYYMIPGIELPSSYSFTIYGQTNQTGSLSATGGNSAAGIGGSVGCDGGSVTINGGDITVSGTGGIAGGTKSSGEVYPATRITINRGTVNAHGSASGLYGKEIFISTDLEIKADNNNPPTTVITNSGSDLSSSLNYKQYVTIEASKHTTYTITATATNGIVMGGGDYAPGATVTLGVIPNAGYEFIEWSDGSKDNPYTFTATKDVTLEATCSLKKFTITTSATNGTVLGGGQYEYGATVTLGAIPNKGYEFKQWSDGTKDNPYTFTATKNVTIEAIFESDMPQGVENHNHNDNHNHNKVLRDGQLLIIRDGKTYTAQGTRL